MRMKILCHIYRLKYALFFQSNGDLLLRNLDHSSWSNCAGQDGENIALFMGSGFVTSETKVLQLRSFLY